MTTQHLGRVTCFCPQRGFGFIQDLDDNVDYFVHYSSLAPGQPGFKVLYVGEYVEYQPEETARGHSARAVTGVRGGPLMCQSARRPG